MPYRRRYRKRKNGKKRVSLAKKAYYMARKLNNSIELKWIEDEVNQTNVSSTGFIFDLFNPPQGLSDSSRVGDKVVIKSVKIQCRFVQNSATDVHYRMILLYDKYDSVSTVADVLIPASIAAPDIQPLRQYNVDNRRKYTILMDKSFILTQSEHSNVLRKYFKRMNKYVQFNAGTQEITRGQIKLVLITNIDTAPFPVFLSTFRFRYTDQ